jgi:hypothetical protein
LIALVERGRLTLWITDEAIEAWVYDGPPQQGAQQIYTDLAIEACLTLKAVYGLTLRSTQGFVESLFEVADIDLPVPDYCGCHIRATLSKRQADLDVEVYGAEIGPEMDASGLHLVIDSTGLKVYGEGEWKQRVHGKRAMHHRPEHRTWRKLHLGVDPESGAITAARLTDNTRHDGSQVEDLLDETKEATGTMPETVGGDGAYDTWPAREAITEREAEPVIPPSRDATITKHGNCAGEPLPRDEAIRYIRKHGRAKWKREHGYHLRSLAETAMRRFKQLTGRFIAARTWANEVVEVRLRAKVLNVMQAARAGAAARLTAC